MKAKLVFLSVFAFAMVQIPTLALSPKPFEKSAPKLLEAELPPPSSEAVRKVGKPHSKERYRDAASLVKVQAHLFEGRSAATLYVRDIPVFTFLAEGTEKSSVDIGLEGGGDRPQPSTVAAPILAKQLQQKHSGHKQASGQPTVSRPTPSHPLDRAMTVASQLNQFYQESDNVPSQLFPVWNEESQSYGVQIGDRPLLALDDTTLLSDSNQNAEDDIRRSINRLRRLMREDPLTTQAIDEVSPEDIAKLRPPIPQNPLSDFPASVGRLLGEGLASWYGPGFHGRLTANGEVYDQNAMTAAHRSLPFGTLVRVINLNNGRSAVVRINDGGPFIPGRDIDLSAAAAQTLGSVHSGVAPVRLEILGQ